MLIFHRCLAVKLVNFERHEMNILLGKVPASLSKARLHFFYVKPQNSESMIFLAPKMSHPVSEVVGRTLFVSLDKIVFIYFDDFFRRVCRSFFDERTDVGLYNVGVGGRTSVGESFLRRIKVVRLFWKKGSRL